MSGMVLRACGICRARVNGIPFLGTCGGFQHALIELARNELGFPTADHAETNPETSEIVISRLTCSLVEAAREIRFLKGSTLDQWHEGNKALEAYHCNYGLNPSFTKRFEHAGLPFQGYDSEGAPRAFVLEGHPFFVGTLYQPERSAMKGLAHPIIKQFVLAAASSKDSLR